MQDDIAAIAATIPALSGWRGEARRLGGLTNRVWRLDDKVLRIPGAGTEAYINRHHEAEMARLAAEALVSPALLHVDPARGLMVTALVPEAVTMTPEVFATRPGAVARAGEVLRRLHRDCAPFPFRFELFDMLDRYRAVLAGTDVALPADYGAVLEEAGAVRAALDAQPVALAPCHCDPLCENFLDAEGRMWLVDWEYAGMNDPMWDLGDLSVEGRFSEAQDEALLTAYFSGEAPPARRGRMVIHKAMCDLLWTLWGLIQVANANEADDFATYAATRFDRCRTLMANPEFSRHLAAIRAG